MYLVTGVKGQLGHDIVKVLNEIGIENIGVDIDVLDLTDETSVKSFLEETKPTGIIHCAAYTAVDKAEEDEETCNDVNMNGIHIKAAANKKKFVKVEIEKPEHAYKDIIIDKINEYRIEDGKKEITSLTNEGKTKTIKKSIVDSDCGYYVKGEKEKQMAYTSQVVCDEDGYAIGVDVTSGIVHDSQAFRTVLEDVLTKYDIDVVAADAGYKNGAIATQILSHGALMYTSYTRPKGKKGFFRTNDFIYDYESDQVLCLNGEFLRYQNTNKQAYRMYKADKNTCIDCKSKSKCTSLDRKQVSVSVFKDVIDYLEDLRLTDNGKEVYRKRKEKIERLFADWKEHYGMRYLRIRGKERVRSHILLSLACLNAKKMVLHMERKEKKFSSNSLNKEKTAEKISFFSTVCYVINNIVNYLSSFIGSIFFII